ncbi:MAG: hypothetical protein J5678_01255, partial [Bacteroidaceae bacterium]|nr:hypothetical protein [Bacteroidaceae bacterium]
MKKIYSLIALVAMFFAAVSVNAQKYHLVTQATTIEPGATYAILCPDANAEANPYANSNPDINLGGLGATLADDYCLWQVEATGEKSDDGYDLYVLKSVVLDAYWQEEDFEGNLGLDGYDLHSYAGCNANFGPIATAMRMVIVEAGSTGDWRSEATLNSGFSISRGKPVQQEDGTEWHLKLGFQNHNLGFTPWSGENYPWQFWTVEENGPKEKLQELVDLINESGVEYKTGDDPGMYDPATVATYDEALNAAIEALVEPTTTDEQFTQLYADLAAAKEAVEAACNPIKPGYYYFVSGYSAFYAQQGVEKGLYASSATVPMWKDFVLDDILANKDYSYVWQVEATGEQNSGGLDLYYLKNVLYGTVYNGPNSDGYSQQCYLVANGTRKVYFENLGQSQWQVKDNFSNKGLHQCDHGGGSGKGSKIVTWNTGADNASAWYLRTVDPEVVEAAYAYAAQIKLIESVDPIVKEANALYDKLFVVAADYTQPLITEADDTKAPGEEGCQFFSNCKEAVEGRYAALIDGNIRATYKQDDSGNWYDSGTATNYGPDGLQAYFHSKYSSFAWPDAHQGNTPYLAVDISKTPVSEFVLRTARRF